MPNPEAVLARLFDVSNEPMTLTAAESAVLIDVNPAFANLTGYSRNELVGRRAVELGLWADPKLRERFVQRLAAEGRVDDFSVVLLSRSGETLPMEISAATFEQDGVAYLVTVMRDQSARERRSLQYEAILDNAMVGIAFTRDRVFQHANPRFEEMFGWPVGGIAGQPGRVVWASDAAYAEIGRQAGPLLANSDVFEGEFEMARRDGQVFWASVRARAIDPTNPISGGSI